MNFIDELAPASPDKVNLYAPYFIRAATKRTLLPKAITLYYKGGLNGTRFVEGGEKIPFTMTWAIRDLPGDTTRCRVIFDENVDYTYEVSLVNSEFVSFLIDWLTNFRDSHQQDFPPLFYRKLFRVEE